MKHRNSKFGCVRIAQQISHVFGLDLDKDVVRRVLAKHCRPSPGADGPSWLSFVAQVKNSLWSVDLFRCESILLNSHWVMVVMDVFTRRLIGQRPLADARSRNAGTEPDRAKRQAFSLTTKWITWSSADSRHFASSYVYSPDLSL